MINIKSCIGKELLSFSVKLKSVHCIASYDVFSPGPGVYSCHGSGVQKSSPTFCME